MSPEAARKNTEPARLIHMNDHFSSTEDWQGKEMATPMPYDSPDETEE